MSDKDYYIVYQCKKCGCKFGVESSYIQHAEQEYKYISCPLDGRHHTINVISRMEIKRMMEEKKAVLL